MTHGLSLIAGFAALVYGWTGNLEGKWYRTLYTNNHSFIFMLPGCHWFLTQSIINTTVYLLHWIQKQKLFIKIYQIVESKTEMLALADHSAPLSNNNILVVVVKTFSPVHKPNFSGIWPLFWIKTFIEYVVSMSKRACFEIYNPFFLALEFSNF